MQELYVIKLGYYNEELDLFEVKYEVGDASIDLVHSMTDKLVDFIIENNLSVKYSIITAAQINTDYYGNAIEEYIRIDTNEYYFTCDELIQYLADKGDSTNSHDDIIIDLNDL